MEGARAQELAGGRRNGWGFCMPVWFQIWVTSICPKMESVFFIYDDINSPHSYALDYVSTSL